MDQLLDRFCDRERVPAVAAAVIAADGSVEADVTGVRRRGTTDRVNVSDAWHIGSCARR